MKDNGVIRKFESGANRNTAQDKYDYEGFLNPKVLETFAKYMHKHRLQADGTLRDSDNWQLGIPQKEYVKSLVRHTMDLWLDNRGYDSRDGNIDAVCGIIFNAQGWLLEELKKGELK